MVAVLVEVAALASTSHLFVIPTLVNAWEFLRTQQFQSSLIATTRRVATGFMIAVGLGVPLGVIGGVYRRLDFSFSGVLALFRPISPLAWIPLAIIWFGFSERATIFIVAYTTFFPIALNTMAAIRTVPDQYIESARLLGSSKLMLMREVLWPAVLPNLITGIRIGVAVAWSVIVAGELIIGATLEEGLGYLLWRYSLFVFNLPNIITLVLFLGVLGYLSSELLLLIQNRLAPWQKARQGVL